MPTPPLNVALIVAAGTGVRTGGGIPKQFRNVRGIPMLRHSVAAFAANPEIGAIYVAIGEGQNDLAKTAVGEGFDVRFVTGGATRRESVLAGLEAIAQENRAKHVLIHDAARPFLSDSIIERLLLALEYHAGAIPALPVVDSLSRGDAILEEPVDRANLWRIQTPQAFRFSDIMLAHKAWDPLIDATDDARILQANGGDVAIVAGDEALTKFTFPEDFEDNSIMPQSMALPIRTGNGFDVHRLVAGDGIWLCGVFLPFDQKLAGHSDADVALHAITDAVLGAVAQGDIGDHFPPSDPQWRGAASDQFLLHACSLANKKGYQIGNIDVTIICEAPKIGPHRQAMRQRIADIITVDIEQISVKATTTEMLGFTGRGEGIAAQASVTLLAKALI